MNKLETQETPFQQAQKACVNLLIKIHDNPNKYEKFDITETNEEIPEIATDCRTNFPCINFISKNIQYHFVYNPNWKEFFLKNDSEQDAQYNRVEYDQVPTIIQWIEKFIKEKSQERIKLRTTTTKRDIASIF